MQTQTIEKPSALNVSSLEDIIYLLKESEEKWGEMSVEESYRENSKRLKKLFSNKY